MRGKEIQPEKSCVRESAFSRQAVEKRPLTKAEGKFSVCSVSADAVLHQTQSWGKPGEPQGHLSHLSHLTLLSFLHRSSAAQLTVLSVSSLGSTAGDTANQQSTHHWEIVKHFPGRPHMQLAGPPAQSPSLRATHCSGTSHASSARSCSISIHKLIPRPILLLLKRHPKISLVGLPYPGREQWGLSWGQGRSDQGSAVLQSSWGAGGGGKQQRRCWKGICIYFHLSEVTEEEQE